MKDDLDYMHARFYNPGVGRFLSVDPINSAQSGAPQSWNKYAYALNNPLKYLDPDGLAPEVFLLVTGKALDSLRHAALYVSDPEVNLDKVYSFGGLSDGVHTLETYLSFYDPSVDPTMAGKLNLSTEEAAELASSLSKTTNPRSGAFVDLYHPGVANCAQFCRNQIDTVVAEKPDILVMKLESGRSVVLTTANLISYLRSLGLLGRLEELPKKEVEKEKE